MKAQRGVTYSTATVLHALASGRHYGFDIMDATGLPSGTVYPILRRLDHEGLATSHWEPGETAHAEQRPPRRYYAITRAGEQLLAAAVRRYRLAAQAPGRRKLRPALGES